MSNTKNEVRVMTSKEVAKFLRMSISSLYDLTSRKLIPHKKPNGGKIYFFESEIIEWLHSGSQGPVSAGTD